MSNTFIDYDKLLGMLSPTKWYNGKELDRLWNVASNNRKSRVQTLVKNGKMQRRGVTASTQYRLKDPLKPVFKPKKESTLDELIDAATKVGTENAVMKQALQDAKAIINKALESTK